MKSRSILTAIVLAVALAGVSQATVGAEVPAAVSITAHPCVFAPTETGTWEATGAIDDSGTFVRTAAATSPADRPPFSDGPLHEEFVFTSSLGTFAVKAEERILAPLILGVWQIKFGAGAYANTSGHGDDIAFIFDPAHENSCPEDTNRHFTFALGGVAKKVNS